MLRRADFESARNDKRDRVSYILLCLKQYVPSHVPCRVSPDSFRSSKILVDMNTWSHLSWEKHAHNLDTSVIGTVIAAGLIAMKILLTLTVNSRYTRFSKSIEGLLMAWRGREGTNMIGTAGHKQSTQAEVIMLKSASPVRVPPRAHMCAAEVISLRFRWLTYSSSMYVRNIYAFFFFFNNS